ncbi:MAG TPA: arginase family protein [Longimicrobium sp.]|uniref:arginase family protein n=1 Tax=Longimicrobium sp. TaxID=2029185 RepID=UPI002ED9BFBC
MSRDVRLIAVPYDSGIRGWRMGAGPAHLLEGGLEAALRARGHTVGTRWIEAPADPPPAEIRTTFQLAASVADAVREARSASAFPVVLAGNCATAMGTLAGLADAEPAVVWLDAHADFNTPDTTRSGFLDGMALAIATGRCWGQMAATLPGFRPVPDHNVCLIGARDLDPAESEYLYHSRTPVLSVVDYPEWLPAALEGLQTRTDAVYLHIDLDVLDPPEGRANAFAADGGLLLSDVLNVIQTIRQTLPIAAVALTAYDPSCDEEGRIRTAAFTILGEVLG